MPKFFLSGDKISNGYAAIDGSDARHIMLSLRMREGERIVVCDYSGNEYDCRLISFRSNPDLVTAEIVEVRTSTTESPYRAYLYQALSKGDKFDTIVQKAVELGVYAIIPFVSERCIVKYDAKTAEHKCARWQKIAEEAAKQCGRGIIPDIRPILSFDAVIEEVCRAELGFLCYEGEGTMPLNTVLSGGSRSDIRFMIGPEGGFGIREVLTAREKGILTAGLGKRILRCETASGFVLSCLSYEYEL